MTDPKKESLTYIIDFEPIGRRVEIAPGESRVLNNYLSKVIVQHPQS